MLSLRKTTPALFIAVGLALLITLLSARPALAHDRVEIGPYVVVIGWVNEPVIVGERNALIFEITEDGEPVTGLEGTLGVTVLYAGRSYTGNVNPSQQPGVYTVDILPTVRGQYIAQLSGSIEDLEVNEDLEPEEVLPASMLQFPESPPDTIELQEEIDALTTELNSTRTLAFVGIGAGVLGLLAAVAGFVLSRRS